MIERLLIKENLSFEEAQIELQKGLVVFTGVSGAGKSVLMDAILALFGIKDSLGTLVEALMDVEIDFDLYGLEQEEFVVLKALKKEKVRYFFNNQAMSRKQVKEICSHFIRYISQKEKNDFTNENLLALLDQVAVSSDKKYNRTLVDYKEVYKNYREIEGKLKAISEEEKKVEELKEFARFEIQKIDQIGPQPEEYEELMEIKKKLSQKEKVENKIVSAQQIFNFEHEVYEVLELLNEKSDFLDDALQELRTVLESASDAFAELDEVNIEEVLDRIEQLSSLKRRYGSIEEALEYRNQKAQELEHYENLSFEKENLQKALNEIRENFDSLLGEMSKNRKKALQVLNQKMNEALKLLNLSHFESLLEEKEPDVLGKDSIKLTLNGTELESVSSGEFNRLRLALLVLKSTYMEEQGVLILDEIDANLSGEESEGVAKVLKMLSASYQVFAISHQPHICIQCDQHFMVTKEDGVSKVREIKGEAREIEVARMISGSEITQEARNFAKKALLG